MHKVTLTFCAFSLGYTVPRLTVAVIDSATGAQMTYTQLDANVRRLASGLANHGVKKKDILAIISSNSPEWVMMFFAAISIGAVVTTMNPVYTEDEIKHQLDDCGAKFVFTTQSSAKLVANATRRTKIKQKIFVSGSAAGCVSLKTLLLTTDNSHSVRDVTVEPHEDLAVLPYSSGTTGLPKGTMLTHRIVVAATQELLDVDDGTAVNVAVIPFYHIYGMIFLLMKTLTMGKTLLTMDRFKPERFLQALVKYKPSFIAIAPPLVLFLAKAPIVEKYNLSFLRFIMCGGAPLGVGCVQDLKQRLPNATVLGAWGMTETAGVGTLNHFTSWKQGSGGQPRPSNQIQIVDIKTGKSLGVGGEGEVWIRGPNMMKGYWKRPLATKDTITEDGWVKTGDVGYMDKDGFLFIVDRIKELIKVKGFQVAPAELEDLLTSHPGIADAAVIGVQDTAAGELPKAFVVRKDNSLTAQSIQKYIEQKVAPYKQLRGGIQFVNQIPKSPSGKILRRQLRQKTPSKL